MQGDLDDINTIYYNDFGIAFQWKLGSAKYTNKVQLVFRHTGLFLTPSELQSFSITVNRTFQNPPLCNDCKDNKECKSLLINTPAHQVKFAMSYDEVEQLNDLIEGTIFQLNLDDMLGEII